MVRTRLLVIVAGLVSWLATGCSTMSNTEKGLGLGGAIGAGVGTAIGAATGDAGTGALAGGLIGAGVGGLAGADADARERERADFNRAAAEAQATPGPVGLTDVVQLTQRGVSDDVIVNHIRQSRSTYRLSSADIEMLKANHVSDRVIIEMQNSQSRLAPPKTVIVRETAPTTVIYDHGPHWCRPVYVAPPPPIGVGFHFHRRR